MRRLLAATVAVGAVATVTGAVQDAVASPAAGAAAAVEGASYVPPAIAWHACSDPVLAAAKAKCGYLIVPLDYAHPKGTKIKVAVSRIEHTSDAAHYQGAMLVNPGGPGGSGLELATLNSSVPDKVGNDYDWYGFDPRGVGASVPSLSCNGNYFAGDRPPYDPTTRTILNTWLTRSKNYAAACTKAAGHILFNHLKTIDTVADMDSLRKAIGQRQINYYGFSYGTYLGEVYMTYYPTRVRRFVLDSTVDPRRVWYAANLDQDVAFQKTFTIYFAWLAKYHSVYHVGNTVAAVRARYLAAIHTLNAHAAKGFLGGDELIDVFTQAGYYVYGWESIASAWSSYVNHKNPNGLISLYKQGNPVGAGADNEFAVYLGTQCTDVQWPRSLHKVLADNIRYNRKYYYQTWPNGWFNGPCNYWHYSAPAHALRIAGAASGMKFLMIDETYDAATPYSGSLYVRKIFRGASLIEGLDGTTHAGSLSGVSCTDDTVAAYLATGTLPVRRSGNQADKVCPPVPQPDPKAKARSAVARASVPAGLRPVLAGVLR